MVVLGGRRPNALKQRIGKPKRERRSGVRVEYISGSGGEFDLIATRVCEISCFTERMRPTDIVVVRERIDADEYALVRQSGRLAIYDARGFRVLPESSEVAPLLIEDVMKHEDGLLSSLAEDEAWICHWARLRRTTEYRNLRSPLILVDSEDPVLGLLPVAMSEQRAAATGLPFLPIRSAGDPVSIRGAFDLIGGGDFGGTPYGGLWQIERQDPDRPSVCVHRAVAIFKRYAGLPKSP